MALVCVCYAGVERIVTVVCLGRYSCKRERFQEESTAGLASLSGSWLVWLLAWWTESTSGSAVILPRRKDTPNKALQQTGHANDASSWRHAAPRVSRLLSLVFGLGMLLMSVILVDLGDEEHDVMINNTGWRNTVEVLRSFRILKGERLQRLQTAWLGEQFTQEEAQAIGQALLMGPLSAVSWVSNVYPPSEYWKDALGGKLRDYDRDTYWPSWLRAFAGFCLTCKGFVIY